MERSMSKERLDVLLVNRGLAESREKAKAIIMSGNVYVEGQKEDKAGSTFADTANIEVRGTTLKYVSRGGLKLEKAMENFDVTIKGNASQGTNDLISLNEVSDYITEKGYTSKDFEESLMGRFREDIIRSWGASDLLFSGINADGWYLDDDKNRGISLTYDGDGYVCEVVIWSGEKETGVDR